MAGDDDVTEQRDPTLTLTERVRAVAEVPADPARYRVVGEPLGRGGMGEVVLAEDDRVGRLVALKRMRRDVHEGRAYERFLREAMIQARLEHPSIVPVHDLGVDETGRPYFTMKRISGTTLFVLLQHPATPLSKLLRVFVDVCNALQLAHARGVVHRDVKPANIMVGELGEVYLLDWGVARVLDASDVGGDRPATEPGHTLAGAILGTPGYMAPEQARGEPATPSADVYALGAVLFEILSRQPLHAQGDGRAKRTLRAPTASPAVRAPDRSVPPELDAVCMAALAADPGDRPTAAELGKRVQQYLDGDRDLERRRELARAQLAIARDAVESEDPARRVDALQAAARALALDPESPAAAAIVSALILTPPAEPPPGLRAALAATEAELVIRQRRAAAISVASYFLFLPLVLWMGVESWPAIAAFFGMVGVVVALAVRSVRRRDTRMALALVTHALLIGMLSRIIGPFVLLPALASVATMSLIASPALTDRRWWVIAAMAATIAVPVILEAAGVLGHTWSISGDRLAVGSSALALPAVPATVFLLASNLAVIVFAGLFAWSLASTRRDAIRRAESQAWHLAQLLPRA